MKKKVLIVTLLFGVLMQSQNYKYGKVSIDELKETSYSLDPTAPAAILYNERTTRFEYDPENGFFIVNEYFMRIKLYNKEGFDYATKAISLYNDGPTKEEIKSIKGTTYNLKGNDIEKTKLNNDAIFLEKTNKYWNKKIFTMPNIQEGCVIEFSYELSSPFWSKIDEIVLQTEIPIKKNNVNIYVPEYYVYNVKTKGYETITIKNDRKKRSIDMSYTESGSRGVALNQVFSTPQRVIQKLELDENIYSVETNDIPAIRDEPYSGNIKNYAAGIVFELSMTKFPNSIVKTYSTDWEAVVKYIYENENFGDQMKDSKYFNNDIQNVIAGKVSESDKINAILAFVKSKIKHNDYIGYYTDEGVKKAYKNGVGNTADINLNLVNMLRSAGFEANPVLVSTEDNGIPLFPSRTGFNYVIASVNTTQGKVLLDATELYSTINVLPYRTLNFNGREVKPNGTSDWIPLFPTKHSINKTIINAKLTETGFEGNSRKVFSNNYALSYRKEMAGKTKDEQLRILNEEDDMVDILDLRISTLDEIDKDVIESVKFETDSFFEDVSGKTYITPLLFLFQSKNPFKLEKREFPVFFKMPWAEMNTCIIAIPDDYEVESLPLEKEIVLPNNLGVFQYKLSQNGKIITAESNIAINEPVILPSDYQIIKDFYKDIVAKHTEKIVLVKK